MANRLKKIVWIISLFSILFLPTIAQGEQKCSDGTTTQFIPCACLVGNAEKCGLTEFAQLFANLYSFGLKYLGALALLLFVIGGIMFMVAGGNQERVTRARHILVGTTIGLMIVLGSYLIVDQFQKMLGVDSKYGLPGSQPSKTECETRYGLSGGICQDTCQEGWTVYPKLCGHNSTQSCCIPPVTP